MIRIFQDLRNHWWAIPVAVADAIALIGAWEAIRKRQRRPKKTMSQGPAPQLSIRPYGAGPMPLRFTIQNLGIGTACAVRPALDWDFALDPMTLEGLDVVRPSRRKIRWDPGMCTDQPAVWVRLEFCNDQEQWYRYVIQCIRTSDDAGWKIVPETEAQILLASKQTGYVPG